VVEAKNTAGTVTKTSNVVTPARQAQPGDSLGGGYFIGQIRLLKGQHDYDANAPYAADTIYNLIASPAAQGQKEPLFYKDNTTPESNPAISQLLNDGKYITNTFWGDRPGNKFAKNLAIGGHSDWYVPARDELEIFYRNLKPTSGTNYSNGNDLAQDGPANDSSTDSPGVGRSANQNSVPPGPAYTDNNPAQTTIAAFQQGGSEAFPASQGFLWSSTEYSGNTGQGWGISFGNGNQGTPSKNAGRTIRAIRREKA
jgi:hypothetical protein